MIPNRPFRLPADNARGRLLEAGVKLVRSRGFAATSVADLCAEAGVTKGAFFHHFASKENLGIALADYWSESTLGFFGDAPYRLADDPLERILGYIDLRIALIGGPVENFSCVAGTMVQENFRVSDRIRAACRNSILANAAMFEDDMAKAVERYGVDADPAELAQHMQTVLQGAFVMAKTQDDADAACLMAQASLRHLKRYLTLLFTPARGH